MLRLTRILGRADDEAIARRLHALAHAGRVERIVLSESDIARHHQRALTDRGTHCQIALPRSERLYDNAVLWLDEDRAVVVRTAASAWLGLGPRDAAAALELGYFAGNMHWRVRFDGAVLHVALDGAKEDYLERLQPLLADGRVRQVEHG